MLHTLGFRIPANVVDDLLGSVVTYPLTEDFQHAWSLLPTKAHDGAGRARPRYAALANALTAIHNQPVRMFDRWKLSPDDDEAGVRALLTTTAPFRPHSLATAVRAWEKAARGGDDRNQLAPLIPPAAGPRPLSTGIAYRTEQVPRADGWVYETVAWQLMRHVAASPLHVPGHHRDLALRLDTDGVLLAWNDALSADISSDDGIRTLASMLRITVRLATMPGVPDLVAVFDAHMSRLTDRWPKVRHAWIRRNDDGPILRVGVRAVKDDDHWCERARDYTVDVVTACGLDPIDLPEQLPLPSGDVRALVPGPRFHPIGKGVGTRLYRNLVEHITATLPDLQPLSAERTAKLFARRVTGPPTIAAITAAVTATGFDRLRIVCLYTTSAARQRMLTQLTLLASTPPIGSHDDEVYPLTPNTSVVFRRRTALLAHGRVDRTALLDAEPIPELEPDAQALTAAWIETEWHATASPDRAEDAKHALRRLLGRVGIPTQFLATAPIDVPTREEPRPSALLHAARSSMRDLLRASGVIDHRIAHAATARTFPAPLDTPATLIGIHARRQSQGHGRAPLLVLCLTAIHAMPDDDAGWHAAFFHGDEWRPYGIGAACFHASAIGDASRGRSDEKAENTRRYVEGALATLLPQTSGGRMVVLVDAEESRTIWPGLQNDRLNDGALPGDTVRDDVDVAIVRCNDNGEIPRPTHRTGEGRLSADPQRPAAPERRLYRFPDVQAPVWYLPRSSVTYQSKGGDLGARYTRWTLPGEIRHLNRDDWHSHRATEIAVVSTGSRPSDDGVDAFGLAVLTARLCEQAAAWDHRTRHPSPLHLAVNADLDHPDYRSPSTDDEWHG